MSSLLHFPTRIHLGQGAVGALAHELSERGLARALIVTDPETVDSDAVARVRAVLEVADVPFTVFDGAGSAATEAAVHDGVSAFRQSGADHLVAVGGGAVLDLAKGVRLLTTHSPPLAQYAARSHGERFVSADQPPLFVLPTGGFGGEVTAGCAIALAEASDRAVVSSPHLMPTAALCDPELTLAVPPRALAADGLAALAHNTEAYLAAGLNPLADAVAIRGIAHANRHLLRAYLSPEDLEARLGLMVASIMAGTAAQKGLGATHALARALENVAGIGYGVAAGLLLPAVLRFVGEVGPERVEDVATALGGSASGYGSAPGERAARRVEELRGRLDLPATLAEAGVAAERIPDVVQRALADGAQLSSPRPVSAGDLRRILDGLAGQN